jgi:serine O-acetyltransferase
MGHISPEEVLLKNVALLSKSSADEKAVIPFGNAPLPSVESLKKIVELVKAIVFPGFFDKRQADDNIRSYYI